MKFSKTIYFLELYFFSFIMRRQFHASHSRSFGFMRFKLLTSWLTIELFSNLYPVSGLALVLSFVLLKTTSSIEPYLFSFSMVILLKLTFPNIIKTIVELFLRYCYHFDSRIMQTRQSNCVHFPILLR